MPDLIPNPVRTSEGAVAAYTAFLKAKVKLAVSSGFDLADEDVNPILKGHQRAMVRWCARGGRRAIFAAFGLGKSVVQLELVHQVARRIGKPGLIVAPLGVRQEFYRDAKMLGLTIKFVRSLAEVYGADLYLTNYETVRDGKLDPRLFGVASLDEASCLRGFGGSKTFREFMRLFDGVPHKFVATATPAPNEYIELLAYAAFLEVMDVGEAKTRFFKRDSTNADHLTLHPHKVREFWMWVASWALFVQRPSDLGFSDEGYDLPPMEVIWHEVPVDHRAAGTEKSGQGKLFRDDATGVVNAAREKRDTMIARANRMVEILRSDPLSSYILWHDLEAERAAIEKAVPGSVSVYGSQDLEDREEAIVAFSNGWVQYLAAKPSIAGSGCNFQRHCHKAIFLGVGFKFNDFIQAVHRIQRFLQQQPVEIHIIHAESEREVVRTLLAKWRAHEEMTATMTGIIREFGLSNVEMHDALTRSMGLERVEVLDPQGRFRLVNNDTVLETQMMADESVDLIVTSIPFATQYEYSPSYNDFGHTESNEHFWEQMGFLIGHLLRVLRPGRIAAIHVKDRIVPGGMTGLGFQTVYPFADDCRRAFMGAGFAYMGEKTNLTDVVRENNQTYRLGHSEQLKDGTKMGVGLPEKVLLFRRPPSDNSNSYADVPVVKARPVYVDQDGQQAEYSRKVELEGKIKPAPVSGGYSRARWQIDAHHLMRSSGDRLVTRADLAGMDSKTVRRTWQAFNMMAVYDFEHHVRIGEELAFIGRLPPDFMLLPPFSWHPDVWTDVAQMRSLNTEQAVKGLETHLCPLPFDIVDRLIAQFSMADEVVFDPFGGLMTVPYCAIKAGRRGIGCELNPGYFLDGVKHVEAMAREMATPSLFDHLEAQEAAEVAA